MGGQPRVHVEHDGSPAARHAAELIRRHVVLMTGTALPERGSGAALRFEKTARPGYEIEAAASGAVVRGDDCVRAAYDILRSWGCRFDRPEPVTPRQETLRLGPRAWRRERPLLVEAESFDASLPATGVSVRGVDRYRPEALRLAHELGYPVRVASTSFDDFLPPKTHFEKHPEWFALRGKKRQPRGNFALTNADARAAYLDALGRWLDAHPEVDRMGIWPEVTTVWCEESLALGAPEAYALLWREAARRFGGRRFEILATGLTLRPPEGRLPENVEVRFRPGREASGLQGIAGQKVEAIVKAWEVRGARVVLEIDAAPDAWCGMPWPCHEAVRANARRFRAAVLRGGGHVHAALWRDPEATPDASPQLVEILRRARGVRSWGHPRDAADLFFDEDLGIAFRIGAFERLHRIAMHRQRSTEERRSAAGDAYLGFRAVLDALPAPQAAAYRRYRARDYRRMLEELLPGGVRHEIGPAKVKETFDHLELETDRLRLAIDRRTASIVSLQRSIAKGWSAELAGEDGSYFAVVALASKAERTDGKVKVTSPATGRVRVELAGRLSAGGPGWSSVLEFSNASGIVRQRAKVDTDGGIAAGCRWRGRVYDRWVCPPYAREGRIADTPRTGFRLPAGTLLYCRVGEDGPGLALRVPRPGVVSLVQRDSVTLVATASGRRIDVEWIVFTNTGELGK